MKTGKYVEEFLMAIERGDFRMAESLLSKDFRITGFEPDPVHGREYLAIMKNILKGIPDFRFNFRITRQEENLVEVKIKMTGIQTHIIPSLLPGMKDIQPTDKWISMPEETAEVTIRSDRIERINLHTIAGGGLQGLVKQIGAELPEPEHH
ncbi:MAG: nuclear transport factor 2 family protein [Syntrophothermus sp.]